MPKPQTESSKSVSGPRSAMLEQLQSLVQEESESDEAEMLGQVEWLAAHPPPEEPPPSAALPRPPAT